MNNKKGNKETLKTKQKQLQEKIDIPFTISEVVHTKNNANNNFLDGNPFKWITPHDVQDDQEYIKINNEYQSVYEQHAYGYIYLITNIINGKQYVGQTTRTPYIRYKEHVEAAQYNVQQISLLEKAMRHYGLKNFILQEIEYCPREQLDAKEIYWIAKYDCCAQDGYEKGYNWQRGGHYTTLISKEKEKEICQLYLEGKFVNMIASQYNVSPQTISDILRKYNIDLRTKEENLFLYRQKFGYSISAYDNDYNLVQSFESICLAEQWIKDKGFSESVSLNRTLKNAALVGYKAFGYYWELANDCYQEYYESRFMRNHDIVRNPIHDKYHNYTTKPSHRKDEIKPKELNKDDIAKYNTQHRKNSSNNEEYTKTCSYEGCSEKITQRARYCWYHANKEKRKTIRPNSIEIIRFVALYGFENAARIYHVSSTAIRKWLKQDELPYTHQDVFNYAMANNIIEPIYTYEHIHLIKCKMLAGQSLSQIRQTIPCNKLFYNWLLTELQISEPVKQNVNNKTILEQRELETNQLLNTFKSSRDAAEYILRNGKGKRLDIVVGTINKCCRGTLKTAYGYIWQRKSIS